MTESQLRPGVYETLLTQMLAKRLPADERLYRLGQIPAADVPELLARYMADLIETVLRGPAFEDQGEDRTERRIAYCNETRTVICLPRAEIWLPEHQCISMAGDSC